MDKVRILRVVSVMDPGGIETQIMNIFRGIDRSKYVYDFLVTTGQKGVYDEEIKELGGEIYYISLSNFKKAVSALKNLDNFFKVHSKEYQIVHSHLNSWSGIILYFAKKYKIPVRIAHSHTTSWGKKNAKTLFKKIIAKGIPFVATDLWAVGLDAAEWLYPNKKKFVKIMPNSKLISNYVFDKDKRYYFRKQINISEEVQIVTQIGSFTEVKNHNFTIKIIREIKNKGISSEKIKFLMIGDGTLKDYVQRTAKNMDIEDYIIFYGTTTDIGQVLSASDLLILPSFYEGMPNVVLESQINGCPILISDTITKEVEIIDNLVSYLPFTISIWIKSILNNPSRKVVTALDVPKEYRLECQVEEMERFYDSI